MATNALKARWMNFFLNKFRHKLTTDYPRCFKGVRSKDGVRKMNSAEKAAVLIA